MLHTILHDVGYLLNPLNLVNEPWTDSGVMTGFRLLLEKWNTLLQTKDSDSVAVMRDRACAGKECTVILKI